MACFTLKVHVYIGGSYVGIRTVTNSAFRAAKLLGRSDVQMVPVDRLRR